MFCGVALAWAAAAATEDDRTVVKSLTLNECVARALANNLDIQIERLNPRIQSWNIVHEQGAFEPSWGIQVGYSDAWQPLDPETAASLHLTSTVDKELRVRSEVTGRLPTGMQYDLSAFDTRYAGTLVTNFLFTGGAGISLTQPLLRNFGLDVNNAGIAVARKGHHMAEQAFRQQVINSVTEVSSAYYELVYSLEDLKARQEDLNRAKALLRENRKRVEAGVISPLDVTQTEAGVAEREEVVIVGEQVVRENENVLKRLTSRDLTEWQNVALVPADRALSEAVELDLIRSTRTALETRPDFLQAKAEVERRGILVKYTHNQLWPQIDLQGGFGLNGRGFTLNEFADDVRSTDHPQWSVGVMVTVPLGNRQARANYYSARLEEEKSVLALKRLEQNLVIDVDNAVRRVQTNLKRMDATHAASRLAEASLKAEDTKLRAGTSTSFLVLQAQAQLAAARSAEIRARADYSKSLVDLSRAEGTTLVRNKIRLAE